ncbi:hypothetical protein SK128_000595 [Halocaridina rubra]|uniref:Uncharacterized protein n=1 Tax=Halocaridina rubra TaxID=373956 RepID=A0AAN9AFB5_HALRR
MITSTSTHMYSSYPDHVEQPHRHHPPPQAAPASQPGITVSPNVHSPQRHIVVSCRDVWKAMVVNTMARSLECTVLGLGLHCKKSLCVKQT